MPSIYKYIVLANPFEGWTSETPAILLMTFGIALFFALLFSIPFTLIRKKIW
jgi:predicted membrane protein